MKTFIKISLFVLFAVLSNLHVVSLYGEVESKTSLDTCEFISDLGHEQPEILEKGLIDSKIFSSNSYANELLAEEIVEEKIKTKKKSTFTAYHKDDNALSLLKFTSVRWVSNRFNLSNIPLYKLFHSWKIHLL